MSLPSKATTQDRDQQILQAIAKDLQTMPNLYLGGSSYTPGSLAALIQSRIDAANAVDTAKANWQKAVKTYWCINEEASAVVRDLRYFLIAAFGESSAQLADFGFKARPATPAPPATLQPADGAVETPKVSPTRRARIALSKKRRKAKIKLAKAAAIRAAATCKS